MPASANLCPNHFSSTRRKMSHYEKCRKLWYCSRVIQRTPIRHSLKAMGSGTVVGQVHENLHWLQSGFLQDYKVQVQQPDTLPRSASTALGGRNE